jgi:hypothetical protein
MTAAQKFQALLVPATLDATGPELCVQNQRAMLDLKGVLEHLIRQEASMLSSALSLQLFADADATDLLREALRVAQDRVVVKRPLREPPLLEGVQHRFEGTTVRYDLYNPKLSGA